MIPDRTTRRVTASWSKVYGEGEKNLRCYARNTNKVSNTRKLDVTERPMVSEVEIATTMRARGRRRTRSPNGEIRMRPMAYLSGSSDVAKNQKQGIIET